MPPSLDIVTSPSHLGVSEIQCPSGGFIDFHAVVSSESAVPQNLAVELWCRVGDVSTWSSVPFENDSHGVAAADGDERTRSYSLRMPRGNSSLLDFTIRYKSRTEHDWSWLTVDDKKGQLLIHDGGLSAGTVGTLNLSDIMTGYDSAVDVEVVTSRVSETRLLVIAADAPARAPERTATSLGKPKDLAQWLSLERLMSFWMEPNQGRQLLNTPRDSFLVVYQRKDGSHVVLLPISGLRDECQVTLLTDKETGELVMHTKNDGKSAAQGRVIVGQGTSLSAVLDSVFAYTRSLFQTSYAMEEKDTSTLEVGPTWYEEWSDGLFYCTWNAMYSDVTEQKILDALAGLDKLGIKVNGIIIDDGWQDIDDQRRWRSFVPPKEKFPHGLGGTVTEIKRKYPYIKHVGVWHAILGYWNGMSPDSWISKNYSMMPISMRKITVPNGLMDMHIVDKTDVARLYDDFYTYLSKEGISVVKCDVQAAPDDIAHSDPENRTIWRNYQDAFKLASLRHFDRRVVYCMSHVADILLYSLLQKNAPPAWFRNSNDFFPDQPESHAWHIFWNANNDLYSSRLNVLPDWDMFDTTHPQARLHALSRSLSGGPMMITDGIDKSDPALVRQMVGKSISSNADQTRVLRYQRPAECRYPYLNFKDGRFTKITNRTYDMLTLGVFNTTEQTTSESVALVDFATTFAKDSYLVYQYSTLATAIAKVNEKHRVLFPLKLNENEHDVFFASPILDLPQTGGAEIQDEQCAVIGLIDKFAGPLGVASHRLLTSSHPTLSIQIAHLGSLAIWFSHLPDLSKSLVTMREVVVPRETVTIKRQESLGTGYLMIVDVERAWEMMKMTALGNEVNLKIYLRR